MRSTTCKVAKMDVDHCHDSWNYKDTNLLQCKSLRHIGAPSTFIIGNNNADKAQNKNKIKNNMENKSHIENGIKSRKYWFFFPFWLHNPNARGSVKVVWMEVTHQSVKSSLPYHNCSFLFRWMKGVTLVHLLNQKSSRISWIGPLESYLAQY